MTSWFDGVDAQLSEDERLEQAAAQAECDAWLRARHAPDADGSLESRVVGALLARRRRRRVGWLLAAAAVALATWGAWPAAEVAIELAPDLRLERFQATVRVLGPRTIRLDGGEIRLAVDSGEAVEVITTAGRIATRGRSRVLVGVYPTEPGATPMTSLRTLVLAGAILLTTPHGDLPGTAGDLLAGEPGKAPRAVARRHVDFSLELHRTLARSAPKANLVTAPHTVAAALALAYQGARGQTARELARLLRVGPEQGRVQWEAARLSAALGRLEGAMDSPAPKGHGRVRAAAAVWADDDLSLRDGLAGDLMRQRAGLFRVDVASSRERINEWVATQTGNTIRRVLPEGSLTDARLVLTSAMHFAGEWVTFFDRSETRPRTWTRLDGTTTKATMMSHINVKEWPSRMFTPDGTPAQWESAPTRHPDAFRAIELRYKGGRYGLLCLMTNGRDRLPTLEAWLTAERLRAIAAALKTQDCDLVLPRLSLNTATDLRPALAKMGAPNAFGAGADFGGFTTDATALPLLGVHHAATLRVDERGTEAGGATAIPAGADMMAHFRATRPFLFALRDRKTGAVLFLGRVTDPTVR